MGEDIDFVRALLDTYKASANETIKQMNLEELRDTLGEYDLSEEEQEEIKHAINKELKGMGISPAEEAKEEVFVRYWMDGVTGEVLDQVHESLTDFRGRTPNWRGRLVPISKGIYEILEKYSEEIVEAVNGDEIEVNPEAKLIELINNFKTNPDGIAEALEAALPEEKREFFADLIRKRLEQSAEIEAIDWGANVAEWQKGCEEAMGIPMYRTRYLKRRFEDPEHSGKYMVLAICYSPKARPYKSEWFNNVPLEDIEHLETT